MPLLSPVGRRRPLSILFLAGSYALLGLGAVSMVLPAMIMITASLSNDWDYDRYDLLPWRLLDGDQRYLRFLSEKHLSLPGRFPRDFRLFAAAYDLDRPCSDWRELRRRMDAGWTPAFADADASAMSDAQRRQFLRDYTDWINTLEPLATLPLFGRLMEGRYREFLRQCYRERVLEQDPSLRGRALDDRALALLVQTWGEARFTSFDPIDLNVEAALPVHLRGWMPALHEPRMDDYRRFLRTLPGELKIPLTTDYLWLRFLESRVGDVEALAAATQLRVTSLSSAPSPSDPGFPASAQDLAQRFLHEHWPLWLVELPADMAQAYRQYLLQRAGSLQRFNALVESSYATWSDVPFTGGPPVRALERNFWADFLRQLPPQIVAQHRVDPVLRYRQFLRQRYDNKPQSLAEAYGWPVRSFDRLPLRLDLVDQCQYRQAPVAWTCRIALLNYRQVGGYLLGQERAVLNTFVLVMLSILCTLTVNPLAAYALSRFPMPTTSWVLLFLLATTAFPAEISMIPNFLLLRELGLLNTFAALLLPGLANGFAIFLLKGFFDSLPRELYEAAQIDGAGELTMFSRITLPLSSPILAYQALLAFMGAYSGFMWAFLVCQDQSMWTIMVWIYQYQQAAKSAPYTAMAAFVLASIPTLLVFLACQRVILRGIVIPSMK
jgi:ABC-type glycerol-3-phosphate transport system permease component